MKFCPHCGGDLSAHLAVANSAPLVGTRPVTPSQPSPTYDQTKIWRELVALADERQAKSSPPTLVELVDPAIAELLKTADPTANVNGLSTVVHIVFDRIVTPRGGSILQAVASQGQAAPSVEQLKLWGYLVVDGKVVEVDGCPVGRGYGAINYWGGDKQFKRWHLAQPVEVNPSRNGDPLFMDDRMVAFGAIWRDVSKIREAMINLLSTFSLGVGEKDGAIAYPFALKVTQRA